MWSAAFGRGHLPCGRGPKVLRVLILEDEPLIALDLRSIVEESGHEVIGVVGSLSAARAHLADPLDFALLDIDVTDGMSFDLAATLIDRDIPFAFVSEARPCDLPPGLGSAAFIAKPFEEITIRRCLEPTRGLSS
jgi:DNA-binding response OmpR family regulator